MTGIPKDSTLEIIIIDLRAYPQFRPRYQGDERNDIDIDFCGYKRNWGQNPGYEEVWLYWRNDENYDGVYWAQAHEVRSEKLMACDSMYLTISSLYAYQFRWEVYGWITAIKPKNESPES